MVNNSFSIIGTCLTNFELASSSSKYPQYRAIIEVEKMGSKFGSNFELPIIVYATNKAINPDFEVQGHLVCINGYLDSYKANEKDIYTLKLVAQNLYLLDKNDKKVFGEKENDDIYGF